MEWKQKKEPKRACVAVSWWLLWLRPVKLLLLICSFVISELLIRTRDDQESEKRKEGNLFSLSFSFHSWCPVRLFLSLYLRRTVLSELRLQRGSKGRLLGFFPESNKRAGGREESCWSLLLLRNLCHHSPCIRLFLW